MQTLEDLLSEGLKEYALSCPPEAVSAFRAYFEALEETNRVMNLTAISGEEDVARLHFLDCAALLTLADFSGRSVFDIGTGAGFPGLVLKILCPDVKLTLLDSLDKRIGFLRQVCDRLQLDGVQCIHARAEEIPQGLRESADIVTSRAVASLNILAELCLPYVKEGWLFIAMKGPDFDAELEEAKPAVKTLVGKCEKCVRYRIPGTEVTHSAILIRKIGKTPDPYPRRWAQMRKKPL